MNRISRVAVLVTALASLFTALSSTAGAVTFTNSGGTGFHATGGQLTYEITSGAGGGNLLTCTGTTMTGSVPAGAFTTATGTLTFSPCSLVGVEMEIACSYSWIPVAFDGGTPGVTTGVAGVNCVQRLATSPNSPLCTITGTTPAVYTNPASPTPGRFTLTTSNTLVAGNASDASCSVFGVPTGTTRTIDLTDLTITLTSAAESPIISSP